MKNYLFLKGIFLVLSSLNQGAFGVAPVVTTADFAVTCGTEGGGNTYGPIDVTLTVPDALTVEDYTVYVFSDNPSPPSCEFNRDSSAVSALNPANPTYTDSFSYTWAAQSLPAPYPSEGVCDVASVNASHVIMKVMVVEGILFTAEDKVFNIICEYQPASVGTGTINIDNDPLDSTDNVGATGTPNTLDRNYALSMHIDATGVPVTSPVTIGTYVNLRVTMSGTDTGGGGADGDENAVRVESCTATDDAATNSVNLITNRCRDVNTEIIWQDPLNPADRLGFFTDNTGELSESPAFEMFAITGGNTKNIVSFTCNVEVCRILADCQGDNCPSKRRKRDFLRLAGVNRYRRSTATTGHVMLSTSVRIKDENTIETTTKNTNNPGSSDANAVTCSLLSILICMMLGLQGQG